MCLLLFCRGPPGAAAFNMLPKLPSFRHHLFFHPATPAPPEAGGSPLSRPTTNLSPSGDNSGGSAAGSGEEHPLHAGAGTLVDVARRRFWRWTVWRRLYHSSVVTVLKQVAPPAMPSLVPRRPRLGTCVDRWVVKCSFIIRLRPSVVSSFIVDQSDLHLRIHLLTTHTESSYTKPSPFQLNTPDAGPVTVASTSSFNSVHLVTRAAAPEQKSLIYVNGTEVSGHLRSAVSIPSPPTPLVTGMLSSR